MEITIFELLFDPKNASGAIIAEQQIGMKSAFNSATKLNLYLNLNIPNEIIVINKSDITVVHINQLYEIFPIVNFKVTSINNIAS